MRLNLDVDEAQDLNNAVQAALMVMQQAPTQEVGTTIPIRMDQKVFAVTKNKDESYTSEVRR